MRLDWTGLDRNNGKSAKRMVAKWTKWFFCDMDYILSIYAELFRDFCVIKYRRAKVGSIQSARRYFNETKGDSRDYCYHNFNLFHCNISFYLHPAFYYPMGGEVTILAKQADNYGYYITVEQGKPDDAGWGQFELKCTQEQYEAVDVGDVVKCDREQSIVTNSGTVHKIQKR